MNTIRVNNLPSRDESDNDMLLNKGLKIVEDLGNKQKIQPFSGNVTIFFINIDENGNGDFAMKTNNHIDDMIDLLISLEFDSTITGGEEDWKEIMKSNVDKGKFITSITYVWPDKNDNDDGQFVRHVYGIRDGNVVK